VGGHFGGQTKRDMWGPTIYLEAAQTFGSRPDAADTRALFEFKIKFKT